MDRAALALLVAVVAAWYGATGLIESGEFQGRKVNLGFISSGVGDTRMLRVNPAELKLEAVDQ